MIITILLAAFTGCGADKKTGAAEVLSGMESYTASAEVTYISNRGQNIYETVQYAKKDGRYRIETLKPEQYAGSALVYDGKMVWQTDGANDKIKVTSNSPERSLLLLFDFWENHQKSMEDAVVSTASKKGVPYSVLSADIPGENRSFCTEKLWFDEEKGVPVKLVVYNADNAEKIVVNFTDFKYNETIDESVFLPMGEKEE